MYCWELWGIIPGTGERSCLVSIREAYNPEVAQDGCRSAMEAFMACGVLGPMTVDRIWHSNPTETK